MPKTGTESNILPGKKIVGKEYYVDSESFDDRDGLIWFDGEMVPWRDARVHVLSHALHYASAVFEGERVYGGEIFKLTEHTERLAESAQSLGFQLPYGTADIDAACHEVCTASLKISPP